MKILPVTKRVDRGGNYSKTLRFLPTVVSTCHNLVIKVWLVLPPVGGPVDVVEELSPLIWDSIIVCFFEFRSKNGLLLLELVFRL